VGVPLVLSSLSERQHNGFELPDRDGPGLAIDEYPLEDELKFDSEVVLEKMTKGKCLEEKPNKYCASDVNLMVCVCFSV